MTHVSTNLRVIRRSRHRPSVGDVFAMQLPDDRYLFGRVIGADLDPPRAPMPGAYLIYVYRHRSTSKVPDWAALQADRLLLPPVFINRMPWTRGYFETVDNQGPARERPAPATLLPSLERHVPG